MPASGITLLPLRARWYWPTAMASHSWLLPLPLLNLKGDSDNPDHAFVSDRTHYAIKDNVDILEIVFSIAVQVKRYFEMVEDSAAPVGPRIVTRICISASSRPVVQHDSSRPNTAGRAAWTNRREPAGSGAHGAASDLPSTSESASGGR